MSLEIVGNTLADTAIHPFTDKEKNFVVEFAYKTGDKELTDKLIDELAKCSETADRDRVISKFKALFGEKPEWAGAVEDLLVAMETLRLCQERFLGELAERLEAIRLCAEEISIDGAGIGAKASAELAGITITR
jgi:hypothetical protein